MKPVLCPYCNEPAELVGGRSIYPHRPDLFGKKFYRCEKDKAWVGCHNGGIVPLGRLANAELRAAKSVCHALFDPLWKRKMERDGCAQVEARSAAYAWLAKELNIPRLPNVTLVCLIWSGRRA